MSVSKDSLGLLNPVTSNQDKYLRSTQGSKEVVRAVMGGGGFSNANRLQNLSEERRERKEAWDVAYESRLKGLVRDIKGTDKPLLIRAKITGS